MDAPHGLRRLCACGSAQKKARWAGLAAYAAVNDAWPWIVAMICF